MLIAGNWKMFKGPSETETFCRALQDADLGDVDVVVCPPYTSLETAVRCLANTEIGVFAQNCHWAESGAFTGEISTAMLLELGVYGTIVGHSERRQLFGETDEKVARRTETALAAGLDVIACVGETEAERDAGETEAVLRRQVGVLEHDENLVIAYEPVWAIGTGKTATPQMAQDALLRKSQRLALDQHARAAELHQPQRPEGQRILGLVDLFNDAAMLQISHQHGIGGIGQIGA